MPQPHPNLAVLGRIDVTDLPTCADAFAEDAVWHFFNPQLPEIAGDYRGRDGIEAFFAAMAGATDGTFRVNVKDARAVGDELVVVETVNEMVLEGGPIAVDVVVVWRIVDGKVTEVWDIPAVYSARAGTAAAPC